jgi:hypothetical protein
MQGHLQSIGENYTVANGFGKTEWLPLSGHSTCDALASLFADAAKALSIDLTDEMKNIHPVMKT